jgi:hypothetical protein
MRRILPLLILLSVCLAAGAQSVTNPTPSVLQPANGPGNQAGWLFVANFAHWAVQPGENGGFSWTNTSSCYGTSGGITFKLFAAGAPITIVDANPAETETVTASSAQYGGWGCSVALPATHPHKSFYLTSGTAGLQEAANWANGTNAVLIVTPDWTALGGTSGMLTTVTVGAHTSLLDARTSNFVEYTCSTTCTAVVPPGGSVTAVSIASANGFSGTSSGGATPALTITYAGATAVGTGTYTTATSDAFTVTGVTSSSHCAFSPTNATAAAATVVGYISAVAANSVTITHVATSASGGTVDIVCTAN